MKRIVRIRNKNYKIVFKEVVDNHKDYMGLAVNRPAEIHILKGMTKKATDQTLIHEILHTFEYEYHIKIPHSVVHDLEEPIRRFIYANILRKKK